MDIRGIDLVRIREAEAVRDAIFGNVGTLVSFGVGPEDGPLPGRPVRADLDGR